jgi:transcriptional regulator of nitric oxide reductase
MKAIVGIILAALIIGMVLATVPVKAQPSPDVNGDSKVDIKDIIEAAKGFGSVTGDPKYKAEYDMNEDGAINIRDLVIIAKAFGS